MKVHPVQPCFLSVFVALVALSIRQRACGSAAPSLDGQAVRVIMPLFEQGSGLHRYHEVVKEHRRVALVGQIYNNIATLPRFYIFLCVGAHFAPVGFAIGLPQVAFFGYQAHVFVKKQVVEEGAGFGAVHA